MQQLCVLGEFMENMFLTYLNGVKRQSGRVVLPSTDANQQMPH